MKETFIIYLEWNYLTTKNRIYGKTCTGLTYWFCVHTGFQLNKKIYIYVMVDCFWISSEYYYMIWLDSLSLANMIYGKYKV